jgi:hypothetical protein
MVVLPTVVPHCEFNRPLPVHIHTSDYKIPQLGPERQNTPDPRNIQRFNQLRCIVVTITYCRHVAVQWKPPLPLSVPRDGCELNNNKRPMNQGTGQEYDITIVLNK